MVSMGVTRHFQITLKINKHVMLNVPKNNLITPN